MKAYEKTQTGYANGDVTMQLIIEPNGDRTVRMFCTKGKGFEKRFSNHREALELMARWGFRVK